MTEPDERSHKLDGEIDLLKRDVAAMERSDPAIPLPRREEDDDGVGQITGMVP